MCGIAGYRGAGSREMLQRMLEAIGHRGPDDRGLEVFGDVGIGQNRLAVIDLSPAGHQPMFDEQRSVAIVFNGEIHNFKELRATLERKYRFRSQTDTEAIIYAYKEHGFDCVRLLRGMFAFVIYDFERDLVFGARDRAGEKPLKYLHRDGLFAFASENKALVPALGRKPMADPRALHHYLTLQYVPAPLTGFREFRKLPAAHYFVYQRGELSIRRYWSLDYSVKRERAEAEWQELIVSKLRESVRIRMESDVPLGAFLSGGVDSSAVVAMLAQCSAEPVKTFSIGFEDPRFDERRYARVVAERYGTDHTEFVVDNAAARESFEHLVDFYDEPIADNSILPTFLLSRLTRQKVTVALTGDGGDENFAGYDRHNIVAFSELYRRVPAAARRLVADPIANAMHGLRPAVLTERAKRFSNTFDETFHRKYQQYNCFFTSEAKAALYADAFRAEAAAADSFELFAGAYEADWNGIDKALAIDIHSYLPEDLLYKTDTASMAWALELRSPFLDHEFMELAASIPPSLKVRRFDKKHLLKKTLVEQGVLPREVVYRRKQGFNFPLDLWLRGARGDGVKDLVFSEKMRALGMFDRARLESLLARYDAGSAEVSSNQVFALVALAGWAEAYL
jgi:asparagine synthase (glutamine-hydrolysing)